MGHRVGPVVGGHDHGGHQGVPEADLLLLGEGDVGGAGLDGVAGLVIQDVAVIGVPPPLQGQGHRQYLGDAGRGLLLVHPLFDEDLAGGGVHDTIGIGDNIQLGGEGMGLRGHGGEHHDQHGQKRQQAFFHLQHSKMG